MLIKRITTHIKCQASNVKHSQAGLGQLAILLLLVGGIALGTYLVQNRTNLLPQAAGTTACDGQSLSGQSDETKSAFQAAYGGGAAEAWVNEHEQELKNKGLPCNKGSNTGGGANNSDKSESNQSSKDNSSSDKNKNQSQADKKSCSDANAPKRSDGYKWAAYCDIKCVDYDNHSDCPSNTSSGFVNPKTSRWCFGFKEGGRCLKLVTTDDKEAESKARTDKNIEANKTGNTRTVARTDARTTTGGSTTTTVAPKQAALNKLDKFRNEFKTQILDKAGGAATSNSNLSDASKKANEAFDNAKTALNKCGDSDQTCIDQANKIFDLGKVSARLASFFALSSIESNVKEVCARMDFGIDPSIKAQPADTTVAPQLVYLCSGENGTDRKWRWFDSNNQAQKFADETKWKPNATPDQYPAEVKLHITSAEALVTGSARTNLTTTPANPNPATQSATLKCRDKATTYCATTIGTGATCSTAEGICNIPSNLLRANGQSCILAGVKIPSICKSKSCDSTSGLCKG